MSVRRRRLLVFALLPLAAAGCAALLQLDDVTYVGTDAAADGATLPDGSEGDGSASVDASTDAPIFHPLEQPGFWTFSDVYASDGDVSGYSSAVFDGQYLYLVPSASGVVVRYDTTSDFGPTGRWQWFDLRLVSDGGGPPQLSGATFDGRYVYFAPGTDESGAFRFDTSGAFTSPSSWETFSLETLDPGSKGYRGAAFRDPYVYFVPSFNFAITDHGNVVRFEKSKSFSAASSWEHTDVTASLGVGARGFSGAVVTPGALFLVPGTLSNPVPNRAARYDFAASFAADAGGWTLSDVEASVFYGGAYDGRYVYLAPCCGDGTNPDVGKYAARRDTQSDAGVQWTLFNTTNLDLPQPSASGAAFDGRRVYFVPSYLRSGPDLTESGVVTAFDTTGSFVTKAAWSQFDLVQIDARAKHFQGAAFDGRYVYFVPSSSSGRVARFEARDTQAPFDLSFASFF